MFLKLRNALASQEFVFIHIKKYLGESNYRMVFKLLGVQLPKGMRDKLARNGADLSDFLPQKANNNPPHFVYRGHLGVIEDKPPASDDQLRASRPRRFEDAEAMIVQLDTQLKQTRMENETLQSMSSSLREENSAMKAKIIKLKNKIKELQQFIKITAADNKGEKEILRLMFLSKKKALLNIINNLKTKLNSINSEVDHEIRIRDALLDKETEANRKLRSEILKAKDVLMN